MSFAYRRQTSNGRYDRNLRAAIDLARGDYCFLLGNDDCLASPSVLHEIWKTIEGTPNVGVVISNYADYASGAVVPRVKRRGPLGAGVRATLDHFRDFSFVSGIVLHGDRAKAHATEQWDGSEMYQMYLACRILAEGYGLLGADSVSVRKDVQLPSERVDSYSARPREVSCPVVERPLPLGQIGRLVISAVEPYVPQRSRARVTESVMQQLFMFTYFYWVLEFRRVQSWKYALGVCLGMRPARTAIGLGLGSVRMWRLRAVFGMASLAGLCMPLSAFRKLYPALWRMAKSRWARGYARMVSR